MAYRTILAVLTAERDLATLDAAVMLAQREDAHLSAFCLGVDHSQAGYYFAGASAYVIQESIDRAMSQARALEQGARDALAAAGGLRWSVESAVAQMGGLGPLIGMRARFADLTVCGRPYSRGSSDDAEAAIEAAMFEGGSPVLIVPEGGLREDFASRILLAWNQSDEALAAARKALPLLVASDWVHVAVVDPSPAGPERSDPGGALAEWLTRHGAKVEVAVLARTLPRVSEVLARCAREIDATMIVMGAYGHSRFREAILGGATRNMLQTATLPVLMAR